MQIKVIVPLKMSLNIVYEKRIVNPLHKEISLNLDAIQNTYSTRTTKTRQDKNKVNHPQSTGFIAVLKPFLYEIVCVIAQ